MNNTKTWALLFACKTFYFALFRQGYQHDSAVVAELVDAQR